MSTWRRWFKYGKAKVESAVRDAGAALDRKEAELRAEQAAEPWLADDGSTPSFEQTSERIDQTRTPTTLPPTTTGSSGLDAFDVAKQQRAADERLASIRKSLGIDDGGDPPPAGDVGP